MRRLVAASTIVVAAVMPGQTQEPAVSAGPRYVEVPVLQLKDTDGTPAWRLFAMKTSSTTVTWAIFRDDVPAVPAIHLAINATPPVPVQMVKPALFELWASELADVLRRDTLHRLLISVGGREQSITLTGAQRLALWGVVNSIQVDAYAEDAVHNCLHTPLPTDHWVVATREVLKRRFGMAFSDIRPLERNSHGRVLVRTEFSRTGVPATVAFVPSRTGAFNVATLRAIAGARVPPPPEANDGIVELCVEFNRSSSLPDVGDHPKPPQE